jgi:Protein of unknown function DUF262
MVNRKQPNEFTENQIAAAERQIVDQSEKIEFYVTEYTIEILAQKMNNGDFEVPPYQREYTWENERKSRFIESILMGLPVPFLFFWENPETGQLEVVDGSQRLRTLEEFVLGDFPLGKLDELSLLTGFRFRDFSVPRQRKIKNRSIRGIVLSEHTNEQSRFDLFERINTSSKVANPSEVRRGALGGPFQDLVIALAKDPLFVRLAPVPAKAVLERKAEELVTRFFAYGDGLDGYRDNVKGFMFQYTKTKNSDFLQKPKQVEIYKKRFIDTMKFIELQFQLGFRKTATAHSTPSARFEAIAIGSYLALKERPKLLKQSIDVSGWLQSPEFSEVTGSDGANVKSKLLSRINFVRDKLLEV